MSGSRWLRGLVAESDGRRVLDGVDIEIRRSEIHALIGTDRDIVRILRGELADIAPVVDRETRTTATMSISENIFLGREITGFAGLIDRRRTRARAQQLLDVVGVRSDPGAPVRRLGRVDRRLVALAQSLVGEPFGIVLVDILSGLDDHGAARVSRAVRRIAGDGYSVILLSEELRDVLSLAERMTIIDGGRIRVDKRYPPDDSMARRRDVVTALAPSISAAGIEQISRQAADGRPGLIVVDREVGLDLAVARGASVALVGLPGSGVDEFLPALAGDAPAPASRTVIVDGRVVEARTVHEARAAGIVYATGDPRRYEVTVLGARVRVSRSALGRMLASGVLDGARDYPLVSEPTPRRVRLPSGTSSVGAATASIESSLDAIESTAARAVLLDRPLHGRNDQEVAAIIDRIRALAARGPAVVVRAESVGEAIAVADEIVVWRDGVVSGTVPVEGASAARILDLMLPTASMDPGRDHHDRSTG